MRAASVRDACLSVHQAATFFVVLSLGGISSSAGIILFALMAPFSMITQPTRQFLAWLCSNIGLAILLVPLQPILRSSNHVPFGPARSSGRLNLINFPVIL